jgi:hypothetical protein
MKRDYRYPFIPDSLFQQEYRLTRVRENVEMFLYAVVASGLPFILGHQQLVVGVAVNAMLAMAALNLTGRRLLPVILLPSVGAYFAGLLFGASSAALLYMIPAIWIGNAIFVLGIKELALARGKNRLLSLGASSIAKSAFLFIVASALYSLSLVPVAFLAAFGVFQLATALGGGLAAFGLQEAKRRLLPG